MSLEVKQRASSKFWWLIYPLILAVIGSGCTGGSVKPVTLERERVKEAETLHTPVKPLPLEEGGRSYPTIDNLDKSIDDLTQQISSGVVEGGKTRIAIAEFRPLVGNPTNFEKYLAEELITRMAKKGQFTVVERALLEKALKELALSISDIVNPGSAKKIGMLTGADSILVGTIADLGERIKVNSRLIGTETGDVFAVASVSIFKDDVVKRLLGAEGVEQTRHGGDFQDYGEVQKKEVLTNSSIGEKPLTNAELISRFGKHYLLFSDKEVQIIQKKDLLVENIVVLVRGRQIGGCFFWGEKRYIGDSLEVLLFTIGDYKKEAEVGRITIIKDVTVGPHEYYILVDGKVVVGYLFSCEGFPGM